MATRELSVSSSKLSNIFTLPADYHSPLANIKRVKSAPQDIHFTDMRSVACFPASTLSHASSSVIRNQDNPTVLLRGGFVRSPVGNGMNTGFLAQVNPVEATASLMKSALEKSGINKLYQQGKITAEQMTHEHATTMPTGLGEQPGMQIAHLVLAKDGKPDHGLASRDVNVMCAGGGRAFNDVYSEVQTQGKGAGLVTAFEVPSQSSHAVVKSRRDYGFPDADVQLNWTSLAGGQITLNAGLGDEVRTDFTVVQKDVKGEQKFFIQFTYLKKPWEVPLNLTFIELKNRDGYRAYQSEELMWELAANDAKRFSQTYLITQKIVDQLSSQSDLFGGGSEQEKTISAQKLAAAFATEEFSGVRTITFAQLKQLQEERVLTESGVAALSQTPLLTREQLDIQAVKEIIRAVKGMEWTADEMGDIKTQQGASVLKIDQAIMPYAVMLKDIPEDQWEAKLLAEVQKAKPLRQGEGEVLTLYHCSRVSDGASALAMVPLSLVEEHLETLSAVESRVLFAGSTAMAEEGMTNFGFLKAIDTALYELGFVKEDGTPDYMRIDQWEIHEPFTVTLTFLRNILAERGFPAEEFDKRVNIHGSSGRLGHPPANTELRKIGTLSRSLQPGQIGLSVVGAAGANHTVAVLQAPQRD